MQIMICENCGKEHDGSYGSGRFCCLKCAHAFATKNDNSKETKLAYCTICGKEININKRKSVNTAICEECKKCIAELKFCKIVNEYCTSECELFKHNLCDKSKQIYVRIKTLSLYFGNVKDINSYNVYKNIVNIKELLVSEINQGISCCQICFNHTGSYTRGNTLFKWLGIKTRNRSDAAKNFILNNKQALHFRHKIIRHTTWNNKNVCLRSSNELVFAKELDDSKIEYEVESIRINYFDTNLNKERIAIPDFYLPLTNTLVEIKSTYTLDIQNMKDKFKAYNKLGYNTRLIVDFKDVDITKL